MRTTERREGLNRPRYGDSDGPDGQARLTGSCGTMMEFWLRVRDSRIALAAFITDGPEASLATGTMMAHLAQGRTPDDAARIGQRDVLNALGGLPKHRRHCARLAVNTLRAAIESFRRGHDRRNVPASALAREGRPGATQ